MGKKPHDALAESGNVARIDHRSLKDRGAKQIPNIRMSKESVHLARRGIETAEYRQWKQIKSVNDNIARVAAESLDEEAIEQMGRYAMECVMQSYEEDPPPSRVATGSLHNTPKKGPQ